MKKSTAETVIEAHTNRTTGEKVKLLRNARGEYVILQNGERTTYLSQTLSYFDYGYIVTFREWFQGE